MSLTGTSYELPAAELAGWLREQGSWWTVDGDPDLTGDVGFPCQAEELAEALDQRSGRTLLVHLDSGAGGRLNEDDLNTVVPASSEADRLLRLSWKDGSDSEWLLVEDRETAAEEDAAA